MLLDLFCEKVGITNAEELKRWVPALVGDEDEKPAPAAATKPRAYLNVTEAKRAIGNLEKGDDEGAAQIARNLGVSKFGAVVLSILKKSLAGRSGIGVKALTEEMEAEKKKNAPVKGGGWLPDGIERVDGAFRAIRYGRTGDKTLDVRICNVFEPIAQVRDAASKLVGLRIKCGELETTVAAKALYSGKDVLATDLTLNHGLLCSTTRNAIDGLTELFIAALSAAKQTTIVELPHAGWWYDGEVFACANGAIVGNAPGGEVVTLADDGGYKERAPGGVGDADKERAVYTKVWTEGPILWRFGDLMGLAAPCMDVVGCRGGGIGLDGSTRHGKTTAQYLQTGRAGCPSEETGLGGLLPASPSPEALEYPARNATSNPFALDEMQNMKDHRELSRFLFALAGGSGKPRMKRSADGNRDTVTYKVFSSASTERSFHDLMKTAGKSAVGGIVSRYPPISLTGLCEFNDKNKALAEEIKVTLFTNYGHTFPVFVAGLIGLDRREATQEWRAMQAKLPEASGHLAAPAEFFALCQWAGHQAVRIGLVAGMTMDAVDATIRAAWENFAERDEANMLSPGKAEIEALQGYVATHLGRTIVSVHDQGEDGTYTDRAGYFNSQYYYLISSKMDEISGGTGNRAALIQALKAGGYLVIPGAEKGDLTFRSIPGRAGKVRNYRIVRVTFDGPVTEPATVGPADAFAKASAEMKA